MAAETLSVVDLLPSRFEPLRKNRWLLRIEGIDAYLLKTAARPSYNMNPIELDWINSTRYLAGKVKFDSLEIVLHDPIAPSGAQQVMEWTRLITEHVSGRSGYADFYKRDIQLVMLDPVGTVVQLWDIKGAFLESVNYGSLDYADAEAADITISIKFDIATLQF